MIHIIKKHLKYPISLLLCFFISSILRLFIAKKYENISKMNFFMGNSYDTSFCKFTYFDGKILNNYGKEILLVNESKDDLNKSGNLNKSESKDDLNKSENESENDIKSENNINSNIINESNLKFLSDKNFFTFEIKNNFPFILVYEVPEVTAPTKIIFLKNSINLNNFKINEIKKNIKYPNSDLKSLNQLAFLLYFHELDDFIFCFTENGLILYQNDKIIKIISINYEEEFDFQNLNLKNKFPIIFKKNENKIYFSVCKSKINLKKIDREKLPFYKLFNFYFEIKNKDVEILMKNILLNKDVGNIEENYFEKWKKLLMEGEDNQSESLILFTSQ